MLHVLNLCIVATPDGDSCLDNVISSLTELELKDLCVLVNDWNVNSRSAFVCQAFLDCLVRCFSVDFLSEALGSVIPGLLAFTDRHYLRLDRIGLSSSMLDFVASSKTQVNRKRKL